MRPPCVRSGTDLPASTPILSLYHEPARDGGPLRRSPRAITLRRRLIRAHTPSSRREEHPRMAKKRSEPRRLSTPTAFEQARDELFSHILRCGVLEASPEHQKEWFDDTMLYLADRYEELDEPQLAELRVLGERYCRPVMGRNATVGAGA